MENYGQRAVHQFRNQCLSRATAKWAVYGRTFQLTVERENHKTSSERQGDWANPLVLKEEKIMMRAVAAQINKALQNQATIVRPGRTWWFENLTTKGFC